MAMFSLDVDVDKPDEKSIMTYVAKFLEKYPAGGERGKVRPTNPSSRVNGWICRRGGGLLMVPLVTVVGDRTDFGIFIDWESWLAVETNGGLMWGELCVSTPHPCVHYCYSLVVHEMSQDSAVGVEYHRE